MIRTLFFSLIFFSTVFSQTYCAGDQVSIAHQNEAHIVGAGYGEYQAGDIFRLADYNGDLNGGQYHVVVIDMSTSW